jgi:hypothetical protein
VIAVDRRNQLGAALVALAAVLFVLPAVFPVPVMLVHDTGAVASVPPDRLEEAGYRVVAYENLSERGRELYVATLEQGGVYRVPLDRGAPEFAYPTPAERHEAYENRSRDSRLEVVIERPEDGGSLPPADEPHRRPPEGDGDDGEGEETRERETEPVSSRYDAIRTATERPPLGSTPQLLRLAAAALAVVALGTGGYLLSSK